MKFNMHQKIHVLLLFYFFLLAGKTVTAQHLQSRHEPYIIMLSLDGFRWDYAGKTETPNLDKIAQSGVKAESLQACFPTKTFPNHYTIATGLYPDNHGIVNNSFYAPDLDRYYFIRNRDAVGDSAFYGGEPIWVTAEKQGVKTASLFWVGSEAPVKGIRPSMWKQYNHNLPFEQRIDTVMAWLNRPEPQRPHLILWYLHEPDAVGHNHGPDGKKTLKTIRYLDSLVGVFYQKLQQLPIASETNFIIVSDHGMGSISPEKTVILDHYLKKEWFTHIEGGNPMFNLQPKARFADTVFSILNTIEHIKAWKTGELPAPLHYGKNPRTLDIVVVADSSWSVAWNGRHYGKKGTHGYDNRNKDMHAIFYATGKAFKKGYIHPTFLNIHIYSLLTHILSIEPAKNDGDLQEVFDMLEERKVER